MALPLFLDLEHTLRLHRSLIEHYGVPRAFAMSAFRRT